MPLIPAGQRPSIPGAVGDHEGRTRAIERLHLLGVQACYLASADSPVIPAGGNVNWDMQGGTSGIGSPVRTEDPELYDLGVFAAGPAAGKHGLRINGPGDFLACMELQVSANFNDPADYAYGIRAFNDSGASFSQSTFQTATLDFISYGRQSAWVHWAIGAEGPIVIGLEGTNNEITDSPFAEAFLFVVRWGQENKTDIGVLF